MNRKLPSMYCLERFNPPVSPHPSLEAVPLSLQAFDPGLVRGSICSTEKYNLKYI